jgi:thiamine-phosphate pyrophosphorylase
VQTFRLPRVYPITDTRVSGLSHAEQAERLIAGGAELVQLRDKCATSHELYTAAKQTLDVTRKHSVPLIINDRVDLALALKADGVHLGQDDLPPERARRILGEAAIIGYSTHSVAQALDAAAMPVDYIAIGPVFVTRTKQDPEEVIGIEGLRQVRNAIGKRSLVAIGGITARNISQVIRAGADSAAVIASILSDPDAIEDKMAGLLIAADG